MTDLLSKEQAADILHVSIYTLWRWRRDGGGPPWIQLGRGIRYDRADLDKWLKQQTRRQGVAS